NRLDDVIVFDALSTSELTRIVDLQVERLAARLAGRRLTLTVTPAAKEWLALTGFDPVYGARPLRRLVQSAVADQLARGLLAGRAGRSQNAAHALAAGGLGFQPSAAGAEGPPWPSSSSILS